MKRKEKRNIKGQFISLNHRDIIGKKFGKIKVISLHHKTGSHYYYKCKCDCGRDEYIVKERSAILNGINLQCTRCYKDELEQRAANELIGKRFGRLLVLELDHIGIRNKNNQNSFVYKCKCDCGNIVLVDKYSLTRPNGTKSCGCLIKEIMKEKQTIHGMSGTRFYKEWDGMIQRTTNQNNDSYIQYGARGIRVCDRWRYSFENFKNDMYDSYLDHSMKYGETDTTIERINVNGNYEPLNCKWITKAEQNRNMTTNFRLIYNGKEYICADLHKMFCPDMNYSDFNRRIKQNGYKNGDVIDNNTCYDTIFKGTNIICPVIFKDKNSREE